MEEVVSFDVWLVTNGKVQEKTLSVEIVKQCDVNSLAQVALDQLDKWKCYNGASAMCGEKGICREFYKTD